MIEKKEEFFAKVKYNGHGLIPAIIQEEQTKEVLMLAYMNEESLKKSVETGETWFYSRSRRELWHKGATSGHFQKIKALSYDCDADTLLFTVEQIGVACHEGTKSCFHYPVLENEASKGESALFGDTVSSLYNLIKDRQATLPEGSYTTYLFTKGVDKILKKIGEEASEVIIAAKNRDKAELTWEISDLIYHLTVLMVEQGIDYNEIAAELLNRNKKK